MSADEAGEAINSLLKEIDDEMENTVNSDFVPPPAVGEENQMEKWKLPLQDIGDETMEMIVSHNTTSNINLSVEEEKQNTNEGTDNHDNQTKPLVPSRKSVAFREGINLHEYSGVTHDEAEETDMQVIKPETLWKKSSFISDPSSHIVPESSSINMTDSEPEEEECKEIEFTTQDLQEHTVTDLDKKLSHILDSKRNMHKLRQMAEEVDILARTPEAKGTLGTLNFILQPTQPLLPDLSNYCEESRLIQFEANENFTDDNDEQETEEDVHAEYINEILHSPSKIPLTNTIAINNFNRDKNEGNPQTRQSSGSSCCDSVADLTTTINNDRYKLLEYSSEIPSELCSKTEVSKESYLSPAITNHPNTSRVFSVATTVDGYKSAKETLSSPASVSSNSESHDFHLDDTSAGSVEDLGISFGLEKNEETIIDISQHLGGSEKSEEEGSKDQTATTQFQKILPDLPQLPSNLLPELSLHYGDINHSATNNEEQYWSEADEDRTEFTGLHEVISPEVQSEKQKTSPLAVEDDDSKPVLAPISGQHDNFDDEEVAITSDKAQAKLTNEAITDMNQKEGFLINSSDAKDHNLATESLIENSASDKFKKIDEHIDLLPSSLPPISDVGSIFLDDPFGDECETSTESMDLRKPVQPSNYLSIWHMQADDVKSSSPATSNNSQFSQYSVSTGTSASAPGQGEHFFKFKPRIVSRSRFYYPDNRASTPDLEEEYIMANLESALDPMRRNTVISRKIQENIKSRRSIYPKTSRSISANTPKNFEGLDEQLHENSPFVQYEMPVAAEQENHIETTKDAESESRAADLSLHDADEKLELLPCLPDDGLGEDFVLFLDKLDLDNRSIQYPHQEREGSYNIWDQENELNFQIPDKKKSISLDIINKLLEPADEAEELEGQKVNALQLNVRPGILKTPIKEVSIGRGLSLRGYEATVSNDNESEQNSVMLNSFFSAPQPVTPSESPLRKTHVESPFKVLKSKNMDKEKEEEREGHGHSVSSLDRSSNPELSDIQNRKSFEQEIAAHVPTEPVQFDNIEPKTSSVKNAELPDLGALYLRLNTVVNLSIHGRNHHKARYAVEFDNGKNVVQTAWRELSDEKEIQISKEFEVILDRKLENVPKLIVTLKCQYEKPQFEIAEIVEKIPIGKKYMFGKSKFEYKTKYVQRPPKSDDWDYLFAQDGSFGRCEIALDDDFLNLVKFHKKPMSYDLMNEWARKRDQNHVSKKLYELPRRPAFTIGTLCIEACYLARSSPLERFPKTMVIAQSIITRYKMQQSISKEGYLLQDGGDVQGRIQRRFFKLQGTSIFGYHEITKQAKVVINLLKVVKVVGPGDVPKDTERNLTDLVLFGGCFHLIFDNDEKITLSTESATGDNNEWYTKIKSVVELNKCHQPWVKHLCENSILSEL